MSHPIEGLIAASIEKIKQMVDANTIIGEAIATPDGTVVIPVSKLSVGFGSGGSDLPVKSEKQVFGGGAGAGVSITPQAFLIITNTGDVKLLEISPESTNGQKMLEAVPDLIEKVVKMFKKDKPSE
jgi:sporulation protein YtfJ